MLIFKSFNNKITMNNNNMLHTKFHKLIIIFLAVGLNYMVVICVIYNIQINILSPFKLIMKYVYYEN